MIDYYVGLDLGQASDYTALSIIEEPRYVPPDQDLEIYWNAQATGWISPRLLGPHGRDHAHAHNDGGGRPSRPVLDVRHLERLPLGTPYPKVVERVRQALAQLSTYRVALVVDATGVGMPVVDMLAQAGLGPIAISITGGNSVSTEWGDWNVRRISVPKRDLVSTVQVLLQNQRLRIAEALPEATTLRKELVAFKVKISLNAHDSYGNDWREAPHDDLVLAVALPCWYREWSNVHLDALIQQGAVA